MFIPSQQELASPAGAQRVAALLTERNRTAIEILKAMLMAPVESEAERLSKGDMVVEAFQFADEFMNATDMIVPADIVKDPSEDKSAIRFADHEEALNKLLTQIVA